MHRARCFTALPAALAAGALLLAGCGGGGDSAGADTATRQATPAPTQITCPEVTSRKWVHFVQNDSPIRLRLTTDPDSITCSDWSATGNPTNINAGGGLNIQAGDRFDWTLERRAWDLARAAWVVSVEDAAMAARVGEVKLRIKGHATSRATAFLLEINSPLGSDTWGCGRDNAVKVGVMRTPGGQRDLMAFIKAPRAELCRQSGESVEHVDDTLVFFTRAVTG